MSRFDIRNPNLQLLLAILAGIGLGLAYSWKISPVTYVDASPAILRDDFKDQYRMVIAASYTSTQDLARARARLELLGETDLIGELSALAQRMLGAGESFDRVRPLAQLATDLQQGFVSLPFTTTPFAPDPETLNPATPFIEEPRPTEAESLPESTITFGGTELAPAVSTPPIRPAFTPLPLPGTPFALVGQDTVCDPGLSRGLLQIMLMDSHRRQVPGIEIIITWADGENHFFSGLKPELGNGYADFLMKEGIVYSVRVVEGGSFVPNISAPTCTEPNSDTYLGGLLLTFQQS